MADCFIVELSNSYIELTLNKIYNIKYKALYLRKYKFMKRVIIGKTKSAILKNEKYIFRDFSPQISNTV